MDYGDGGRIEAYGLEAPVRIEVLAASHPICAGLGDGFTLTDELYLYPVHQEDVVPLLRRGSAPTQPFGTACLAASSGTPW